MASETAVAYELPDRRRGVVIAAVGVTIGGVATGAAAGMLVNHPSQEFALAGIALLFLPILTWHRPAAAIFVLGLCATVFEQYGLGDNIQLRSDWTDQTRLYTSLSTAIHLSGVYVFPIELMFAAVIATLLVRGTSRGFPSGGRTVLAVAALALAAAVAMGWAHGQLSHGSFSWSLQGARPPLYVLLLFAITRTLVGGIDVSRSVLWALVLGTGLKSLQTLFRFVTIRHVIPRPDSVVSHEDTFFFCILLALCLLLWIFGERGRLRTVATAVMPIVLLANPVNARRTSYAILALVLVAIIVIAWVYRPEIRRRLAVGTAIGLLLAGAYVGAFWNSQGTWGQPARALRSMVTPTLRDKASDQYRVVENADLAYNIRLSPVIGRGYGLQIDYVYRIVDLSSIDLSIKYIPHDGVLYILMRLGVVGATASWFFLGACVLAGGRLLRSGDRRLMVLGAWAVCVVIAYVIQGYYDLGFSWLRIAVFMGLFTGALDAAARTLPAEVPVRIRSASARVVASRRPARPARVPFRPRTVAPE